MNLVKKMMLSLIMTGLCAGMLFASGEQEASLAYPKKTIQIIVPTRAGGATDAGARILAKFLQEELGNTVVVVNQDGGGGMIGMETVKNAKNDGYTLLYHHTQLHAGYYTDKYDISYRDYTPISTAISVNETITVDYNSPWMNLDDFVNDAKMNPDQYIFGVQMGSISHFMAGALMNAADIKLRVVGAGGEVDKLAAMQGGMLHVIMASVGSGKQYMEAKEMRVLAVASEQRDITAPDLPTAIEQGYDVIMPAMHTLYGPKELPEEIVKTLNNAMKNLVDNEEFNSSLNRVGQVFEYRSVSDTNEFVEAEDKRIEMLAEKLGF